MTEETQLRLPDASPQEDLQSFLEWPIAEIFKLAAAPRSFDQIPWVQSLVQEHETRDLSFFSAGGIGCGRASAACALIQINAGLEQDRTPRCRPSAVSSQNMNDRSSTAKILTPPPTDAMRPNSHP